MLANGYGSPGSTVGPTSEQYCFPLLVTKMEVFGLVIGQGKGMLWTNYRRRMFNMDNLSLHHSLQTATIIHNAGHRLAFRAPYYSVDGPIEYVFNTIQCALRINNHLISDGSSLIDEMRNAIANTETFELYFIHCGFHLNYNILHLLWVPSKLGLDHSKLNRRLNVVSPIMYEYNANNNYNYSHSSSLSFSCDVFSL